MVAARFMDPLGGDSQEEAPIIVNTNVPDISTVSIEKRQLGFALTLGGAVFSIGLNSNGVPAITLGPTASASSATVAPSVTAPTTAQATVSPIDTATAGLVSSSAATPINTSSGNTVLPTAPLTTPTISPSSLSTTTKATGLQTTTAIIFAGGSAITSVKTLGSEPTGQSSSGGGLTSPQIAGVVVGVIGGTAALLLLLVLCVRWRRHIRDNKRKSRGGESVRALHTGPAPMMAHNSARFTNMFPAPGDQAVMHDADSARMTFLPSGGAAFLNRASGSPLHGSRPASPIITNATPRSPLMGAHRSVPASPTLASPYKSGTSAEVAFLAADASQWLNRNSTAAMGQPTMSAEPLPDGAAAAIASHSHNGSTRSLPSQVGLGRPVEHGSVTFLPGTASRFLNQQPLPSQSSGPSSDQNLPPPPALAAFSNASTRSLPSQVPSVTQNTPLAFVPGDASAFLNRTGPSPIQSMGSSPPPAPSTSTTSSVPYHTPMPTNGQVTFLPATASGFLNRNSVNMPTVQTPPPIPSMYNPPPSAPPVALAIPPPAHMTERSSAGTASNHRLNSNPEWFDTDYHGSQPISPQVVPTTTSPSQTPIDQPYRGTSTNEVDDFLAASSSRLSRPVQDSYGPPVQSQNPFQTPQAGGSVHSTPPNVPDQQITRLEFNPGQVNLQGGPSRNPDPRATLHPSDVPGGWVPPQPQPTLPRDDVDNKSWFRPDSVDLPPTQLSNITSWPKPPEVDWERPRARPKGI